MAHPIHTLSTSIRHVRAQKSCNQGDYPAGGCDVLERYPAQSISRLFNCHFLPSSPNPTHPDGRTDELCSLQIDPTSKCHLRFDPSLCGCGHGLILRFATQRRRQCQDDQQFGSYICICWNLCKLFVHCLDFQLSQEASDEQHAIALQPGATRSFHAALCYSLRGHFPRLDRGTDQQMGSDYDGTHSFPISPLVFQLVNKFGVFVYAELS